MRFLGFLWCVHGLGVVVWGHVFGLGGCRGGVSTSTPPCFMITPLSNEYLVKSFYVLVGMCWGSDGFLNCSISAKNACSSWGVGVSGFVVSVSLLVMAVLAVFFL